MKPQIYNRQTGKREAIPEDALNDAVASGSHAFPVGTKVNVIDPDGNVGSLDSSELQGALQSGFTIEPPRKTAVREYVDENKGLKGAAKVALGQFADEALMGIPELILNKTQDPLEVAKREALKKEHNALNNIAGVAGFGASLLYGGPIGKVATGAEAAGRAAENLLAKRLVAAGVEKGSESIAKGLAKKLATSATKLGVEGATFSAPVALTEAALGDPDLAAETLLMNGLAGAALGVGGSAVKNLTKLGLDAVAPNLLGKAAVVGPDGQVVEQASGMLGSLFKQKPNAPQIEEAFKVIDAPVMEGALSDSKFIQDLDSGLTKKVSQAGVEHQEKWQNVYDKLDATTKESLASSSPTTALQAGEDAQGKIIAEIERRNQPFQERYQKFKEISDTITIPDEKRLNLYNNMLKVADDNRAIGQSLRPEIKKFGDNVLAFEKASDLDVVSRQIGQEIESLKRAGKFEDVNVLKQLKTKVDDFAENEILRQAKVIEKEGLPEAQALAKEVIAEKASLKKDYSEFSEFLEGTGDITGIKKKGGAATMSGKIDKFAGEKFVNRLFDTKDYRKLAAFKKEFPEAFDVVAGFKKNELLQKATSDGRVKFDGLLRELDKFSPEVRELLFTPEQLEKLGAVNTIWRAKPKDINPSGTARAIEMNNFIAGGTNSAIGATVGGMIGGPVGAAVGAGVGFASNKITGSLKDRAAAALIKSTHANSLLYTEQAMKKTALALDKIPEALDEMVKKTSKPVRNTSVGAIGRFLGDGNAKKTKLEQFEDLSNRVAEFNENPAYATDKVSGLTTGLNRGAPTVANNFATKNAVLARYIQEMMPKALTISSPFKQVRWKPSDFELSQFERRIHAISDPMSIVEDLKNNNLSMEAVNAVKTVYPKLFEKIQEKVLNHFMENPQTVPYQQRIKLSMLLDQPLDSDLQPVNIASLQKNFIVEDQQAAKGGKSLNLPSHATESQLISSK
jgi:hypothetical protein